MLVRNLAKSLAVATSRVQPRHTVGLGPIGMETQGMSDDRIEGGLKKGVGKLEDAWGGLTGDAGTQSKGKANQASGSVQDVVGQAKERAQDVYGGVESYAKDRPVTALAVALGVGVVLGFTLRGSGRN